ncbi:MAG: hypothetical protein ACKV0T_30920 [Planctomycetales bacterium]
MRWLCWIICVVELAVCRMSALAVDPDVQRVIPADTLLVIEVDRPLRTLETDYRRDLQAILLQSQSIRQMVDSPLGERWRAAAKFLETSLDCDWPTAIGKLSAGGLVIAVQGSPAGTEPDVTVIVTADEPQTLQRFLEALHQELQRKGSDSKSSAEENSPEDSKSQSIGLIPVARPYRNHPCYQVGQGHYAVVEHRLLAANRRAALEAAIDRLTDTAAPPAWTPPAALWRSGPQTLQPLLQVTLNLELFRRAPGVAESLRLPSRDVAAVVMFGGYLDLLRRADYAQAALFVDDGGIEARIALPAGADGVHPGLEGFFATSPESSAAPLLTPPRTLFTASWYRDYRRLWRGREQLWEPAVVRQIEAASDQQRQQPVGMSFGDWAELFGPHLRIVLARQEQAVYRQTPDERLPAAAAVLELHDERRFREQVFPPVDRLVRGIMQAIRGEVRVVERRGARFTAIRFAEPPAQVPAKEQGLYHFEPAYGIAQGHLLVCTSSELIGETIDELERLKSNEPSQLPDAPRVTESLWLSGAELQALLHGYRISLLANAPRPPEQSAQDAELEFDLALRLLSKMGDYSQQTTINRDRFEMVFRLGTRLP